MVPCMSLCRLQAPLGGLLGRLVPRARLVPAVNPEDMSPDPKVVWLWDVLLPLNLLLQLLDVDELLALTAKHACQAGPYLYYYGSCSRSRQNAPHSRSLQANFDLDASFQCRWRTM